LDFVFLDGFDNKVELVGCFGQVDHEFEVFGEYLSLVLQRVGKG